MEVPSSFLVNVERSAERVGKPVCFRESAPLPLDAAHRLRRQVISNPRNLTGRPELLALIESITESVICPDG